MSSEPHAPECVFCRIVAGDAPAHRIWEDTDHLAFLSIFPNTEGFSVVIPKAHRPSYVVEMEQREYTALYLAARRVARLLDQAFEDVARTGIMYEGYGVDHAHDQGLLTGESAEHGADAYYRAAERELRKQAQESPETRRSVVLHGVQETVEFAERFHLDPADSDTASIWADRELTADDPRSPVAARPQRGLLVRCGTQVQEVLRLPEQPLTGPVAGAAAEGATLPPPPRDTESG